MNSSISSFKRIPMGFVIAFCLIAITGLISIRPYSIDNSTYLAAMIDKFQILKNTPSPKMVFAGGSNLVFGLNCQQIQKEIGVPVVNMGLHRGLGLRYMLEQIKEYINPGDVVVIVPEYEQFYYLLDGQSSVLFTSYILFPEYRKYITSPQQKFRLLKGMPQVIRRRIRNFLLSRIDLDPVYNRYVFNNIGELKGYITNEKRNIPENELSRTFSKKNTFNEESTAVLKEFDSFAKNRRAKTFILLPCVADTYYKNNKKEIQYVYSRLKADLGIPVLTSPAESVYPVEFFFDMIYHLNADGRRIRTEKVISVLTKALIGNKGAAGQHARICF